MKHSHRLAVFALLLLGLTGSLAASVAFVQVRTLPPTVPLTSRPYQAMPIPCDGCWLAGFRGR